MSRRRPGTVRRQGALLCAEGAAAMELARALQAAHEGIMGPLSAYQAAVIDTGAHIVNRHAYAAELEACADKMEGSMLAAAALVLVAERLACGGGALLDALIAFQRCIAIKADAVGATVVAPPEGAREALLELARERSAARNQTTN